MAALGRVATRARRPTINSVKMCSTTRRHQNCPELSIHTSPHGEDRSGCNNQLAPPWLADATGRVESFPEHTLCRLTPVISRDGSPCMDLTGEVSASPHHFIRNAAMVNASQCTLISPPPGILHVQWKGSPRMLQKHEESIKYIDFLSDNRNFTAQC